MQYGILVPCCKVCDSDYLKFRLYIPRVKCNVSVLQYYSKSDYHSSHNIHKGFMLIKLISSIKKTERNGSNVSLQVKTFFFSFFFYTEVPFSGNLEM